MTGGSGRMGRLAACGIAVVALLVACEPTRPTISTERVPVASVDVPYDVTLLVDGGKPPYTWSINRLPDGLSLQGNRITGTPTKAQSLAVRPKVVDASGAADYQTLQIHIQTAAQHVAFAELNRQRTGLRLRAFGSITEESIKAQAWAKHIARAEALTHSDTTDRQPPCAKVTAENIGVGSSASVAIDAWMTSADARAKIADPKLTRVGVGVQENHDNVYVVAEFVGGC